VSVFDALRTPRVLGVLLAISVAFNVFFAGALAGRVSARWMHPPPTLALGRGFESGFRFVPEESRRQMRSLLREHRPELREEHQAMRRLHREIEQELARPQPDRAAIEADFAQLREKLIGLEQAMQDAFLDTVLALPAEARRDLVENMRGHGRRHHGPHGAPPRPPEESPDEEAPPPPPPPGSLPPEDLLDTPDPLPAE